MEKKPSNKKLIFVIIMVFAIIFPVIFLIDWFEKEITNPRIWKSWTCEEMKQFAIGGGPETLNDFQQVKFDEDLLQCMGR
ncbi:MAG: hypothetical protein R3327_01365 [Nitrosopumilaceae archaeon]|nr:hypothetical protein [Nitrosopumilaceae archaeon]